MDRRQRTGHPSRVRVYGPLAPYADGFRQYLAAQGYHPQVIGRQARLMADLSIWLEGQGRSGDELVAGLAGEYLRARRAAGSRELVSALAVAPVLRYLRSLGAVPAAVAPVPRTPVDRLLAEFAGYLAQERGLSPASVNSYLHHARPFLASLAAPVSTALAELSAAQVTAFMVGHRGQWGTGTAKATVTALRALLRFLHATGRVADPLASAVPSVAGWKLGPLPADVGEALADYVQYARPRCAGRPLLVILRAPYTGLLRAHILAVVHRACQRAGVPEFGPHRLRHAVACDLLRRGASLAEIGQLLRHRDERTTAIYAKVDLDALRGLARPCPEAGAL